MLNPKDRIPRMTLHNGVEVPALAIGTYKADVKVTMDELFQMSFAAGFRAVDAAEHYGNEAAVGQALRNSGVAREEIYLSTKIWNEDHGYEKALEAYEASRQRLGTSIDMLLIHWPCPMNGLYADTWRALQHLYKEGKVRGIGVSNFKPHHLEVLRELGGEQPMVNQIEMHPFFIDTETLEYCSAHGIVVEAWSPLLRQGQVVQNQLVVELAQKYGVSPAQLAIRYLTQYGVRVMVKASSMDHIEQNADIFRFTIEEADVGLLQTLNTGKRYFQDPDEYYL